MTDTDTLNICCLRTCLVGTPGVGMTTTLYRLLKIISNIISSSRNVTYLDRLLANCSQTVAFVSDNKGEWLSSRDANEELKLLLAYLFSSTLADHQARERVKKTDKPMFDEPSHAPVLKMEESIDNYTSKPFKQVTNYQQNRLYPIVAQLRRMVTTVDCSVMSQFSGNIFLNINIVAAQPGFLEMLPALSPGPTMSLVFFDLSKDFDKPYKIAFSRDDTIVTPFEAVHTVEATIFKILSAIASIHFFSQKSTSYPKAAAFSERFEQFQQVSPVVALIGTHKDRLDNPEKRILEINKALHNIAQTFREILVSPTSATSFFPVDNYSGTEQSDIGPIRSFLNSIVKSHFKDVSLPIHPKWLIFGTLLNNEYKIVTFNDCLKLGDLFGMDKTEVEFCIWYLSCTGTLMYYTDIADDEDDWFKNHVICSPQVIFNSISKQIVAAMCALHTESYVTDQREELIKKGQFSIQSIEMYCLKAEIAEMLKKGELIPVKQLVKLLNHVGLLSPIIHTESDGERITYLLPAVLDCASENELSSRPSPNANNPEPVLITFSCGYVPTGTFCGLITRLISLGPHGILGLEWALVEEGVKQNYVSFYVDFVNMVTLICHNGFYEIRVKRYDPKKSLHDICSYVLSVIIYTLNSLYSSLDPQIAFQCSCSEHAGSQQVIRDLCILFERRYSVQFLCEERPVTLRAAQQVWLGKVNWSQLKVVFSA